MPKLDYLPDDIIGFCLKYCDSRNTRIINRRFYCIRNEWFKHKVLAIFPLGHHIWHIILFPLIQYVKELDSIRRDARLLLYSMDRKTSKQYHAKLERSEYICDSWEIIYSILKRPLPLFNFNNMVENAQHNRRDRHFQLLSDNDIVLPTVIQSKKIPLNIWIYIEDVQYARYMNKIITELYSYETHSWEDFFFGCYLHEWIKAPGVYCIKLGNIPEKFIKIQSKDSTRSNIKTPFLPIKVCSYIGNEINWNFQDKLKILGYSFDNFNPEYQWIYFQLPLTGEKCVINKWETIISTLLAKYYIARQNNYHQVPEPNFKMLEKSLSNEGNPIDDKTTLLLNYFYESPMKFNPLPNLTSKDLRLPKLVTM